MTTFGAERLAPPGSRHQLLSGYSGATVLLIEELSGDRYVRKVAAGAGGNERLADQIVRLTEFSSRVGSLVRSPTIRATGTIDGRAFADMEVVDGLDGVTFLRTASLIDVRRFTATLVQYLRLAADSDPVGKPSTSSFADGFSRKIVELRSTLADDAESLTLLGELEASTIGVTFPTGATLCHGDLTLENLLVDRSGSVWMIDHSSPPFEHVWFDIAKIEQDLAGGWYLRSHEQLDAGVRTFVLSAVRSAADPSAYGAARQALLGLTFARILPYTRDQQAREFVLERIRSVLRSPSSSRSETKC